MGWKYICTLYKFSYNQRIWLTFLYGLFLTPDGQWDQKKNYSLDQAPIFSYPALFTLWFRFLSIPQLNIEEDISPSSLLDMRISLPFLSWRLYFFSFMKTLFMGPKHSRLKESYAHSLQGKINMGVSLSFSKNRILRECGVSLCFSKNRIYMWIDSVWVSNPSSPSVKSFIKLSLTPASVKSYNKLSLTPIIS